MTTVEGRIFKSTSHDFFPNAAGMLLQLGVSWCHQSGKCRYQVQPQSNVNKTFALSSISENILV
jgi:hypothetical protein